MKTQSIKPAIRLAEKLEHIFVATADSRGTPHVAAAGELRADSEDRVAVSAWFCPGTLANLQHNKHIALVVWDSANDHGFQLVGVVEQIEELAVLNGFAPEIEEPAPIPQVERRLRVRVKRVIGFSHAPHSDLEDEQG
jgi:hypothetical protein